jgi:hypothetical protein
MPLVTHIVLVSYVHPLVVMPAHHTGFCKYPKPSPLKPCFSMDALRPFFVMTKLAPIANDELTASMRPTYLSLSSVVGFRMRRAVSRHNILVFDHFVSVYRSMRPVLVVCGQVV